MNRIRELRASKGMSQAQLGNVLGCISATVSKYELEQSQLDPTIINILCDFFGVTADYLLCRSNIPNPVISEEDAALLKAYHAADERSRAAIDALLAPLPAADKEKAI